MAAIAGVIFIIAACVGWIDKTVSVQHLLAVISVGLVFIAGHLAVRAWRPDGRFW
jgi:hypothetical protein